MTVTDLEPPRGGAACAACGVSAAADVLGRHARRVEAAEIVMSLPEIHSAACMAAVEGALLAQPEVRQARVNLSRKRVTVIADPDTTPEALSQVLAEEGFQAHELDSQAVAATRTDRAGRDLLMRLGVAGFASMNVMLLSIAVWSGAEDATRDLFHWISAAIALPAIVFAGRPFYVSAWAALRSGRLNMDVPIVLAIVLAAATSLWETALSGPHAYFDAALALTFFLLAGRWLDHRTRTVARSAAAELAALEVPRAVRRVDGVDATVPLEALAVGDRVVVRPGCRMPVDGVIESGHSERDRSLLTGETMPVTAEPGDAVCAGEVNLTGPLVVRLTAVGSDSSLHALTDLVAIAESGRSRYTPLADKAAKLYAPGVHILAAVAFAGWYLATWDMRTALNIAAAVLIITCPCALGLAVPAVTTAASGRLFRSGLLIKNATALERLAQVDTVIFDKTGTLTIGDPVLDDTGAVSDGCLARAAAVARSSAHPLARALATAASERGLEAVDVTDIREVPGRGIEATDVDGRRLRLGRAEWVGAAAPDPDPRPTTWFRSGEDAPLPFRFTDQLRPGATETVAALQREGLEVRLLSGDRPAAVAALASRLGIAVWTAAAQPADKAAAVAAATAEGRRVLMVGDGLNDTAALAGAHVSVSPATALDAARVAADIVLLHRDLSGLVQARRVATRATRRIAENFRIATVYNILAVPLAVAGLATPLLAALAMSASSITVSLNALRLGVKPRRVTG